MGEGRRVLSFISFLAHVKLSGNIDAVVEWIAIKDTVKLGEKGLATGYIY
jgi:hypothetical protein